MSQAAELIVKIGANADKYRKELTKLEKDADASAKRMQKAARVAAAGFAAAAAGGLVAFNAFANFEADFSNVVTLLDDASFKTKTLTQGIDGLKKGVLNLRSETGESFENLNKGLFDLISAGLDAEEAITALGVATNLAIAGGTQTSIAVDGLTSALNAYELSSDQAQSVSEKFFTAQKFGKTTIEELSSGFGQVGATAKAFGVSLDELLAATAAVTTGGINTSAAYTGLNAVLANISQPTQAAVIEAKRLGVQFDSTALRTKGLKGFLDSLTESANFNQTSIEKLFGSVEAKKTVFALAGSAADDFRIILDEVADSSKSAATFQAALDEKSRTVEETMKRLAGAVDEASVLIGEFIAPEVLVFAENLTAGIRDSREELELFGKTIGVVLQGISLLATGLGSIAKILTSSVAFAFAQVNANIIDLQGTLTGNDTKKALATQIREDSLSLLNSDVSNSAQSVITKVNSTFGTDIGDFAGSDEANAKALERQAQFQEAKNQLTAEGLEEERALKLEQLGLDQEEGIPKDLENLTDDEFEDLIERLQERNSEIKDENDKATADEIKAAKKAADERAKIEEEKKKKLSKLDKELHDEFIANIESVADTSTAIGKALFLYKKAEAIASVIVRTQEAMALARATLPPPAGDIQAAKYAIQGAISVGTIGATAIQGLEVGGIVGGGFGGGDKQLTALTAGELVIPKQMSRSVIDLIAEAPFNGGSSNKTNVMIGIEDDAARFITVKQREDRAIGVQR